jgi:hypothetical protein
MRALLCGIPILILCFPWQTVAEDKTKPNMLTPKEIAEGWILLFDGESTFGWKCAGDIKANDGVLVVTRGSPATATSTTAFGEFDLQLEYKGAGNLALRTGTGQCAAGLGAGDWRTVTMRARRTRPKGVLEVQSSIDHADFSFGASAVELVLESPGALEVRNVKLKPIGVESIFNGMDLTGWKLIPGHKSKFSVNEKGELTVKDGNGDLQSDGEWADFILQLDIKSNGPHLNSGVFFRSLPGQFWSGYEAQIRNEWVSDVILKDGTKLTGSYTPRGDQGTVQPYREINGHWGPVRSPARKFPLSEIKEVIDHRDRPIDYGTGGIYNRQEARKVVSSDHEWFTMTVVAHGNHMATWVNGYQVTDFSDKRPANQSARQGNKVNKGPLSLQGHDPTTDLNFRNIRVAGLPQE